MFSSARMVFFAALIFTLPASAAVTSDEACVVNVNASLDALVHSSYAVAVAHFDADLLHKHDAANLEQVWGKLEHAGGAYQHRASPQWQVIDGQRYLFTQLTFAERPFDAINRCDAAGQLSFLEWAPVSDAAAKIAHARPQVDSNGVRELPLTLPSPYGALPGTLLLPSGQGPFPAVLLVVGSGPQDADETIGPNKPMRDLAEGLAAAGVASFRYDKRSYAYRIEAALSTTFTIDDEVTDDAVAALRLLAQQPGVDPRRVFVLGHSLGGMMAPRIGQRSSYLAGMVLLAAPARSLMDVMAQQVREQGSRAGAKAAQIEAGEKAITDERRFLFQAKPGRPLQGAFNGVPQIYWMSLRDYDQVAVAKRLSLPILVLQGGADFQVSPDLDFGRWKLVLAANNHATFHIYPGLSHLFMQAGTSGTIRDYQMPAHVDPQVVRDIAEWVRSQPAR